MPLMHALAREYAYSDCWFASAPTQTWANRAFALRGKSHGVVNNETTAELVAGRYALGNWLSPSADDSLIQRMKVCIAVHLCLQIVSLCPQRRFACDFA